jgi:hypothetical protein
MVYQIWKNWHKVIPDWNNYEKKLGLFSVVNDLDSTDDLCPTLINYVSYFLIS